REARVSPELVQLGDLASNSRIAVHHERPASVVQLPTPARALDRSDVRIAYLLHVVPVEAELLASPRLLCGQVPGAASRALRTVEDPVDREGEPAPARVVVVPV